MGNLRDVLNKQKDELAMRHKESIDRTDQGLFGSIIVKNKIPDGIEKWDCKSGKHIIDIVPWIAGPNCPTANEGKVEYVLDVWVHRNVGAADEMFVCPSKTWGDPCPICEDIKNNDYDKDTYDNLRAKRRSIYLVWVHDSPKEENEGIKVWDVAHFFMQNHLDELSEGPRGGGIIVFSDIEKEGKSIGWTKRGKSQNISFLAHRFIDRDEGLPDDITDQSFSLDDIVKMRPSYEEITKAYYGSSGGGGETETTDREQPDRNEKTSSSPQQDFECPAGGTFGMDTDELDGCATCEQDVWDACAAEQQKIQAQEPEPAKEEKKEETKTRVRPRTRGK